MLQMKIYAITILCKVSTKLIKQFSWKKYTLNCYLVQYVVQYTFLCQIYSFSQPKKIVLDLDF